MDIHVGVGRLLSAAGEPLADIAYEYRIDRTNRVWNGAARRRDQSGRIQPVAGPAMLETEQGERAPVHFRQRDVDGTIEIIFTGQGAPPGE